MTTRDHLLAMTAATALLLLPALAAAQATNQGRDASGGIMAQTGPTTPGAPATTGTTRTPPAGNTATTTTTTTTGATSGTMAVDSNALRNSRRASKVIGSSVYNENNESIGEVDDILIPSGSTSPVAVISVGGFLGIGAKLVAVPYDRLQMSGEGNRWTMTGATKDSLTSLPTFEYETAAGQRG
jgi:sporulation protein YlmC with PRC-barrel domain